MKSYIRDIKERGRRILFRAVDVKNAKQKRVTNGRIYLATVVEQDCIRVERDDEKNTGYFLLSVDKFERVTHHR